MERLFPAGSDGVDSFFVISSFIMAYTMSRPDQRSVRASWICAAQANRPTPSRFAPRFARKSTFN
jgi:peptidoglycan/LPS O-acetylase OafA/YrhL